MKRIIPPLRRLMGLLLASALLLSGRTAAFAASGSTTVHLPLFREDQHLLMPKNTLSHWFAIPAGSGADGEAALSLHITASRTLIDRLSSVMVYLNGTPIGTRRVLEEGTQTTTGVGPVTGTEEDVHEFTWELSFDPALIQPEENNELKITTLQRSIEGPCEDIDNPSNWMVLHRDSELRMTVWQNRNPWLSDYYDLYHEALSDPFSLENTFVLDDAGDARLAEAMLDIAGAAGMHYSGRDDLRYEVCGPDGQAAPSRSAVHLTRTDTPGAELTIEDQNPEDLTGLLHISGDGAGLDMASDLLANRASLELFQSENTRLSSGVEPVSLRSSMAPRESGQYTLRDYGFDSMAMNGVFHQRVSFELEQPQGVIGGEGSYLDIRFRHSEALLSDRSQLTVRVGDEPMASVKLTPSNAETGSILVELSERALREPMIDVTLEVYHYLGEVDCDKDYYDVAWTAIDTDESHIYFAPGESGVDPTLANFPTFHGGAGGSTVSLVLSPAPEAGALQSAAMLATRAGQNTRMYFEWNVLQGAMPKDLPDNAVILADLAGAAEAIPAEVLDSLPAKPTGSGYAVDAALGLLPEGLRGKAVIQVLRSPYDFYKTIYVVVYDGEAGLAALTELLASRKHLSDMEGELCVIGAGGRVAASFDSAPKNIESSQIPLTLQSAVKKVERFAGMSVWVVALILLALVLVVIAIVRLMRRRGDNEYKRLAEQHRKGQEDQLPARDDGDVEIDLTLENKGDYPPLDGDDRP